MSTADTTNVDSIKADSFFRLPVKIDSIVKNTVKADTTRFFTFALCEAENGNCYECQVQLIKGDKLEIGCYIKVFQYKELFLEGYILKHISGEIFILESKEDASNPEICGGCCGDAYSIDIENHQIWGC